MAAWDETKPAGTDAISSGDDAIRTLKQDIRERLDNEHSFTATGDNTECKHNEGSARITTDTSAPANVDDGRLYYDTTNKLLKFANGSVFANLDIDAVQVLALLGYKLGTTPGPQTLTASYTTFVSAAITKKEASSLLIVIGKLVGHDGAGSTSHDYIIANGSSAISDSFLESSLHPSYNAHVPACLFTVISGVSAGTQTINLQVRYSSGSPAAGSVQSGSLLVLEIRNPFTL